MTDKNMADVADKAVDKLASGLSSLASAANKVAPRAWELAVREQRIDAITSAVTWLVLLIAMLVAIRYLSRWWKEENEDRAGTSIAASLALAGLCILIVAIPLPNCAHQYLNAEYFAAKAILEAAK